MYTCIQSMTLTVQATVHIQRITGIITLAAHVCRGLKIATYAVQSCYRAHLSREQYNIILVSFEQSKQLVEEHFYTFFTAGSRRYENDSDKKKEKERLEQGELRWRRRLKDEGEEVGTRCTSAALSYPCVLGPLSTHSLSSSMQCMMGCSSQTRCCTSAGTK